MVQKNIAVAHPFTGAPLVFLATSGAPVKGCATGNLGAFAT